VARVARMGVGKLKKKDATKPHLLSTQP